MSPQISKLPLPIFISEKTEAMGYRAPSSPCFGLHLWTQPSSLSVTGAAPQPAEPQPPASRSGLAGCVLTVTGAAKHIATKPCYVPTLTALRRGAGKMPVLLHPVGTEGRVVSAAGIRTAECLLGDNWRVQRAGFES